MLLEFYDYPCRALGAPAHHQPDRVHVRHRAVAPARYQGSRLPRRLGSPMAFKLIESAETRWRAVNAPHLVALVRAGSTFEKGRLVERPDDQTDHESGEQQHAA